MSEAAAALRTYLRYRYTIVTIATWPKPHPIEAELWYAPLNPGGEVGRWTYFRRYACPARRRRAPGRSRLHATASDE